LFFRAGKHREDRSLGIWEGGTLLKNELKRGINVTKMPGEGTQDETRDV